MRTNLLKKKFVRKRRKNESLFKYIMGLLHLWLGLLSAIVVIVVCFTGCIYAFKNQFSDLLNRDKVYVVEKDDVRKSPSEIQVVLAKHNQVLKSITIPKSKDRSYVVTYTYNDLDFSGYLNPYSGENLGKSENYTNDFFEVILDIHRNLFMGSVGRQINGAAILMFCVLLFSGFILWIPKKVKNLKQSLTVKFNAKFQRVNYDFHNTMGFYACIMLFFIAITGLYITYPWVKNALIVSLGGDSISNVASINSEEDNNDFSNIFNDMLNRQKEKTSKKEEIISLDSVLDKAHKILPYEAVITIDLPNKENPRYVITKINNNNWLGAMLPDQITFDKKGVLKSKELFWEKPLNKQFTSLSKPLHTGEILGLKSIIFYFIICFIGFSLPITGFLIWWNKFKK